MFFNVGKKISVVLTVIIFLVAVYSPVFIAVTGNGFSAAATQDSKTEERKNLEAQLEEMEKQIDEYEATIVRYQKEGKSLQGEIKKLESQIAKLNLQIKTTNLNLIKLGNEINSTQTEISSVEEDIGFNKEILAQVLQELYEQRKQGVAEIFLSNSNLVDFFDALNNLTIIQDRLKTTLDKVKQLRSELLDQKEKLALQKMDAENLKNYQLAQKANVRKTQDDKDELLKVTKGKESLYQDLVKETKKTVAQIRSQIFQLLGGGELSFEEAYRLAKLAEQATGVRAALILAVLDRESALGKNVGRCDYQTAMHPTRDIPIFLEIIEELKLEKDLENGIIKVSCANSDGAYGGAMGPAQFIPSTWQIFKEEIAEVSGHNPPSPWGNADAFIATALYLKNLGAGSNASLAEERKAAARYYAGSRWSRYLWTYGERVISQAQSFQKDIDILMTS